MASRIVWFVFGVCERWPAGRARCARCGHFVTGIPLRVALPLVARRYLLPALGQVQDVDLAVVVEMAAGLGQFGILLVGAEDDGLFAVNPLGTAGVVEDFDGFVVEIDEVGVGADEITEVVGQEVLG